MRRKFNQKGLIGIGTLVVGAAFGIGAFLWITSKNKSLYDVLRSICIGLDSVVYSVSSWAYSIFYEISSSSLLSSLNLASASQRLYTLLGIFMLFRLAFSFIKYIINPEEMEKGTSKLLTNLAVSLALIVSVPWIFNRAFALQSYIMDSNVIGNLIMGMDTTSISKNDDFNASSYGQTIGFLTFSAFYRPDSSIPQLSPCNNLLTYYSDYVIPAGDRVVKVDESVKMSDAARKEADKIAACINALNDPEISTGDTEIGTMLYIASQRQSIGIYSNNDVLNTIVGNTYLMNYTYLVSTIAGGFLALLFLNFSFDVAIRNVKLCFLQIIAPIPIILNIEPGEAKGDKKSLNWWVKECLQTYALLFIRVATVYFGVFLIELLFGSGLNFGSENTSVWFKIFMILGILLFVKQVPDMLGKAFGIDVKGEFKLNPLKRIGENKLASGVLGGAIGFAGGALGSGIAAYRGARTNNAGRGEALKRALTGGIGGAFHSGYSGIKTGAKSIHDVTSNATKNWQRSGRIAASNVGTTLGGRTSSRVATALGAKTRAQQLEDRAAKIETVGKNALNVKKIVEDSRENIGDRAFGAGTKTFSSSSEIDNYMKNNPYLTSKDQNQLLDLRKKLSDAESVVAPIRLNLDGKEVSFRNYDEANKFFYDNDLSSEATRSLSRALGHFISDEYKKSQELLSGTSVDLSGINFNNAHDITEFSNTLKSLDVSSDVKKDFDNFAKVAYNDTFRMYSNDLGTNIGVAQAQLSQSVDLLCPNDSANINIETYDLVKKSINAANVGASAVRVSDEYIIEKRNDAATQANRGGGR